MLNYIWNKIMWTRNTADPLGKKLFERYGMHILSRPRENVFVLQVFSVRDGETFQSGGLDSFLRSTLEKPVINQNESLLDIDQTISDAVSGNIALNFLQGFLAILGVSVMKAVSAGLERSHSNALRFRFGGCTRDYVKDGFELDWKLGEHPFVKDNSGMKEGYRYYIATGVHYCNQLTFEALDKNMTKVDLSADVALFGTGKTGLTINNDKQITAESSKILAYGVELNEIVYDEKHRRLSLQESRSYVHVKAGGPVSVPKAMLVAPEDLMILQIVD
jgi:hypothetical protein